MKRKPHVLENLALITYLGISMTVPIILGLFIGRWIDSKLSTEFLFSIIFIIFGVIASFKNLFSIGMKNISNKNDEKEENEDD